ncbi:hypothetical protein CCP2SC5_1200007 [Azospirillaceae bacterium]
MSLNTVKITLANHSTKTKIGH